MVDKAKIACMAKLAVYDKNVLEKDKTILKFFLNDYVYRQNMRTRIYVLIGYLLLVAFDYMSKISSGEIDIFLIDYMSELKKVSINAFILLALYTVISSIISTIRYHEASKRQDKYFLMISQMEKLVKARQPAKEDNWEYNGSDIIYKRNNS